MFNNMVEVNTDVSELSRGTMVHTEDYRKQGQLFYATKTMQYEWFVFGDKHTLDIKQHS